MRVHRARNVLQGRCSGLTGAALVDVRRDRLDALDGLPRVDCAWQAHGSKPFAARALVGATHGTHSNDILPAHALPDYLNHRATGRSTLPTLAEPGDPCIFIVRGG